MALSEADFARLQRQLARAGRRWTLWVAAAALALLAVIGVFSSYYTVDPEERAVVKRFGAVVGEPRPPGLHFKLPFGIDQAVPVPTERVLKQEFGFRTIAAAQRTTYDRSQADLEVSLMLTGDLNVIDVQWVVQYQIADPAKYLHRLRDPTETLRDVSEAVMRRIVGNRLGSEVLTVGRVEIASQARERIQQILDQYDAGIHVRTVEMQDVTPPEPVKPAFNAVNEARQEKEQLINEAERRRNEVVPKAQGEAKQTIAQAEGDAARRINEALGAATRFTALATEYEKNPDLTRRRLYLEMIEQVLPGARHVYVVGDEGGPVPLLHLDEAAAAARRNR